LLVCFFKNGRKETVAILFGKEPEFADRRSAGRALAKRLQELVSATDLVLLGVPYGGMPVAYEVARALGVPLHAALVRRLGLPGQEELALGAVTRCGVRVLNPEVVAGLRVRQPLIEQMTRDAVHELSRLEQIFYRGRSIPQLRDKTILLIDDGLTTGTTMRAAVRALREQDPLRILAAAPVAPHKASQALRREVDDFICLHTPPCLHGIGGWYAEYAPISEEQACLLLAQSDDNAAA
jgi:putative phosphoribosyl transferase